jgi:anti-sigma factor RsiW
MAGEKKTVRCDRARQWASLRVDGELSELESLMLERHVAGCDSCREWQQRVERTTELLRASPLEPPRRRVELEGRDEARFPLRHRLVLAAVVAAAALGSLLGAALDRPEGSSPSPSPQLSLLPPEPGDQPPARLPPVPRRPGLHGEGAV